MLIPNYCPTLSLAPSGILHTSQTQRDSVAASVFVVLDYWPRLYMLLFIVVSYFVFLLITVLVFTYSTPAMILRGIV